MRCKPIYLSALFVLISTCGAMAQGSPSPAPDQGSLVSYGIALISAIALVALSVMSAKRNHQD
jgi:hypothetical protein